MEAKTSILAAFWKKYCIVTFAAIFLLLYPFTRILLSNKKWFPFAFRFVRFHALLLQLTGGILLIKKYKEKLPENIPFVICPNHSSYLDIVLLYRVFKNHFVFMGKKEIEKAPLFNIYFTSGMNILVDRSSKVGSHKAFKKVGEEIDKGHSVVIFPEGTIPHHAPYLKQPFKNGAFRLAIEKQVPIVPVTFLHNWKRLQGSKLYKGKAGPGYTKVIIHEKIETKGMTDDDLVNLREKVFNIINQPIIEAYGSK